jgi:lysophospholipase L1-like esterase
MDVSRAMRTATNIAPRLGDSADWWQIPALAAMLSLAAVFFSLTASGAPVQGNADVAPRKLVILGASYAGSWGTPPLPGYVVTNRGVGGDTTADMRARLQRDVVAANPDAVLIWGHVNNITKSGVAGATAEQAKALTNAARADYVAMLQQARAAGIDVILATEVPRSEPAGFVNELRGWVSRLLGKESYSSRVNVYVRELNAFVRQLAAREGLLLLDFEKVFAPEGGARKTEFAKEDQSHITDAGYRALTAYSVKALAAAR